MLKFENVTFAAQGANKKDKVYGLTLNGAEDVVVKDCTFNGMGYAAILNHSLGNVRVEGCKFECDNIYNPIEGSQQVENGDVMVSDCEFTGTPGNNFVNFYKVKPESAHTVRNCSFAGATGNNIVRLSNLGSNVASFVIDDCEYVYTSGTADEYTGFMLCQDYTNKNGQKQDFSKYAVRINNLTRPEEGCLFYVYEDGKGIITGENDPQITIR